MEGPMRGIRFIHKAIRTEIDELEGVTQRLAMGGEEELAGIARRFEFLEKVVHGHAEGEEAAWFPTLDQKAPLASRPFILDHESDRETFHRIDGLLDQIAATGDESVRRERALRLFRETVALNTSLSSHVGKEEALLVPITEERFTFEEQGTIVGNSIQHFPPELVLDIVPWMLGALTPDEQEADLRMMMASAPPQAFQAIIQRARAELAPESWAEIARRVPEVESLAA